MYRPKYEPVQEEALAVDAVVDEHLEAAGGGDHELLELLVGVAAAHLAAGHVVQVVDALDVERHLRVVLDHGQVAARVGDPRQRRRRGSR